MLKKNNICFTFLLLLSLSGLFTSCSEQSESAAARRNVENIKKTVNMRRMSTPTFHLPPPSAITYQSSKLRSPFESTPNINIAQKSREEKPLLFYPINMLKFVGTLSKDGKQVGYLLAPDSKIYPIAEGELIGDHGGKVIHIYAKRLEILEQESEPGKPIKQHITVLQLKDETQ